jgi:hypothetical protein
MCCKRRQNGDLIRVRIEPQHPLLCWKANKCGSPSAGTEKNEVPCHSRCDTIKIPPCLKALSAEHRPKFCSASLIMVTPPHAERDVCLSPPEQLFSYPVVFTNTCDGAANFDLYTQHLWLLVVRILLRVTAAATRDLGWFVFIQRISTHRRTQTRYIRTIPTAAPRRRLQWMRTVHRGCLLLL